jgi:hypothetical protein
MRESRSPQAGEGIGKHVSGRRELALAPRSSNVPGQGEERGRTIAAVPDTIVLDAVRLARGVCRAFDQLGYASLIEFPLASGHRADVMALHRGGALAIVEIKSSVADFRADQKWRAYRDWCDRLYFAVASSFPVELIPDDCGLIVADGFGAELLREAPHLPLAAARRRAVMLRFALAGAARLRRLIDPGAGDPELL